MQQTCKFYFTFGSDDRFPYGRSEFVEVEAFDDAEAREVFKAVFPSKDGSPFLNCASVYPEEYWEQIREKYYKGVKPSAIISIRKQ